MPWLLAPYMGKMDASGGIVSGGLNITEGGKIWIFFSLMFVHVLGGGKCG